MFVEVVRHQVTHFGTAVGHPVILCRQLMLEHDRESSLLSLLGRDGWMSSVCHNLPSENFFRHSHMLLAVASGWLEVELGGPGGRDARLTAGDAAVIPGGCMVRGHLASTDFTAVEALPINANHELERGQPKEPQFQALLALPVPEISALLARGVSLKDLWMSEATVDHVRR